VSSWARSAIDANTEEKVNVPRRSPFFFSAGPLTIRAGLGAPCARLSLAIAAGRPQAAGESSGVGVIVIYLPGSVIRYNP
jgi:hypothetical protein